MRIPNLILSFIFFVSSIPRFSVEAKPEVQAKSGVDSQLKKNRERLELALKGIPARTTLGKMFEGLSPLMTMQARSDVGALIEPHKNLPAPRIQLKDDVFYIEGLKNKIRVQLVNDKAGAYWLVNRQKILIKDIQSPEHLYEVVEKILKKDMKSVKVSQQLLPLLLPEAEGTFDLNTGLLSAIAVMAVSMLAGAESSTVVPLAVAAFALGGGPLASWFGNKSSGDTKKPAGAQ